MDSAALSLYFISAVVSIFIIYQIIQSATRSKSIELNLIKQTYLLAKMAQKSGVTDGEINVILNIKSEIDIKAKV